MRTELRRFERGPLVTINQVFERTVEHADYAHATENLVRRTSARLQEIKAREIIVSDELRDALLELSEEIKKILKT